jgi:hypothetical protein
MMDSRYEPSMNENDIPKKPQPARRRKGQAKSSKELACLECRPRKIKVGSERVEQAPAMALTLASANGSTVSVRDASRSASRADCQSVMSAECKFWAYLRSVQMY